MPTPAVARLAALAETAEQQQADQEQHRAAKVIQLPLWPAPKRGAPNAVLRGALFAAVHKDRRYMDRELLAAQRGIAIRFTGKQLDQADLDVWEQALHLARTQALGTRCRFTEKGFLKSAWPSVRQERSRMAPVCLCSAGRCGGRTHPRWPDLRRERCWSFNRDEDTGRTVLEINPPSLRHSSARRAGRRSTGSSASGCEPSLSRCGCTASTPPMPRPMP